MEKDTKARSFRISNDVNEKIKAIATEIGGNQDQVMKKLLEAYELQQDKVNLLDRKPDIETFEDYITCITRMYMGALQDNKNVRALAKSDFEAQLVSKDTVIQDLQKQLSSANESEKEASAVAEELKKENVTLTDTINTMKKDFDAKNSDLQNMLTDTKKLNETLEETIKQQKIQIDKLEEGIKEAETLRAELKKCQEELNHARIDMEQQKIQHREDILALKEKLNEEKSADLIKYQETCFKFMQNQQSSQKEQTGRTASARTKKTSTATKKEQQEK